jgi:hypothetical protein
MAGEPTLYHGNQSVDGWVEYLQQMLMHHHTNLGNTHFTEGLFDDHTLAAVKEFQERKRLEQDGIVGDQTWAALRGEPVAKSPGDDGLAPGTYVERGIELRFTNEIQYRQDDDDIRCWAASVGTDHPASGSIRAFAHLRLPDGSSRDVVAVHEGYDKVQYFHIEAVTGGVPGRYALIMQLPSETGADTQQFEFERHAS